MASRSQISQAWVFLSLIVSLLIAVYSQAPAQAQTAAAPNVIAIGDSVTDDFGNGGWRGPLKAKLAAVGQAINYVGSRSDGAGSHEAYGGASSCDFSTDRGSFMADTYGKPATWDIRTALAAAAPNIAIIDIGTNNYIEDSYLAQGLVTSVPCGLNPGSLRWLWDAVVYYPGITGVVITTIEDSMIPEGTENVNELVRQYVADRQAQGLNVCLGELPSSFAGLTTDRYHLNAAGKDAVAAALLEPTLTAIAGTCAAAVTGTLPVVSIAATANAAEPSTNGQFTVSRTGSTASSLTVNFTVSGSATAGSDYANIGTSMVIPAGAAVATIAVNVIDDPIYEGNETVVVTLSPNASYAVGSANSATVTIADNESAPALSVSPNGASAGDLLTVTWSSIANPTARDWLGLFTAGAANGAFLTWFYVNCSQGGSAVAKASGACIVALPGVANGTYEFRMFSNDSYNVMAKSNALVVGLPVVSIAATANAAEPSTNGQFTVSRTGSTANSLTVNFTVSGSATAGADYANIGTSVVIPSGAAAATIAVNVIDDAVYEGSETVVVTLTANPAYAIGSPASATVTIADDDKPVVSIVATDAVAAEAGLDTGTFTVSRDGATTAPLTVNYAVGGTAINGVDYQLLNGSVTIPAGQAAATIIVTPIDDNLFEGNETVILTLIGNGSYVLGTPNNATVTIIDNDKPVVSIVATDAVAAEAGLDTGTFTVSRDGITTAPLTVNYTVSGTATNGVDYQSLNGSLTIPAGQASATIVVTPIDDNLFEGDETVVLTLATGGGYIIGSPNSATVTIADNDLPATPSIELRFDWQTADRYVEGQAQYADLNGDGKADLILQGWDDTFWVSLSTGTGFTPPTLWMKHGGSFIKGQAQYTDLNGDGKADLILQGWDDTFWVSLSTGTGFTPPTLWMKHGGSFIKGQAQYTDLNGDGKADLILQGWDDTFWVSLSTGTGFTPPTLWMKHGGSFIKGQAQYTDLNGDGKADLILQGWDDTFWVSLSTGSGFTPPTLWMKHGGSFAEGQAQYTDLNGDGKADLILQGWDNTFWVSLSTGTGFTPPTLWMKHGGSFAEGQAQYADLNGDGKADLILQGWDNTFWVSLSTGTGFTPPTLWMKHGGSFIKGQAQYTDLNGDGKDDLIFQGVDNVFWVSFSTGASFTAPVRWP